MTSVAGTHVEILITSTPSVTITDEALTDSGDHTTFTVSTGNAAHRYWDDTATFVFQTSTDGSTWNTATPAKVQYVGGKVTFGSAVSGTHQARVHSGKYLPFSALGDATKVDTSGDIDVMDSTSFTTTGSPITSRTYKPTLIKNSFKLKKWYADTTFLSATSSSTRYVLSLLPDVTASNRLEAFAYTKSDGISFDVAGLTSEDIEFTVTGTMYIV